MEANYSYTALKEFLVFVGEKGLVSGAQAQGWRVATGKLFQDLSDAETADVRKIDVELALRKFLNRNPGKLSPNSLAEYRRRAVSAIEEFVSWVDDPTGYRPRSSGGTRTGSSPKKSNGAAKDRTKSSVSPSAPAAVAVAAEPQPSATAGLPLPYPLRSDFLAQVVIPRDMTMEEARRLGAFLNTLAVDFKG